ncbi:AlwI family type II restriction endonuclease [Polynucleobacter paneuropaeus]|nr:AlwI family type II restriction endonuclease [Polynucleobacter paneuropaeus]MBT8628889.1 AlwI family type II restriction endonuclease [Polynucleobacter paneuropaeus]
MAKGTTSRSRAWFFPTSPRSPYKLQGELKLLKAFDGKVWDEVTQLEFAKSLANYDGFEGNVSKDETAFSARDRLRGPALLGFICKPKARVKDGKLQFTDIGNLFLSASIEQQELIFQRQIAKVQFRSHLHSNKGFEDMNVRPLMLMIKLLLELDKMSKEEVALFALTLTDYKKIDIVVNAIKDYRLEISKKKAGLERKTYKRDFAIKYVNQIYKDDIDQGRTKLREGGKEFSKTKLQTLKDYSDSSIRYLRATGLFTLLPHGQTLALTKAKIEDSKFLLKNYGMGISSKTEIDYEDYVMNYLGNPSLPQLRIDNNEDQQKDFLRMFNVVKEIDKNFAEIIKAEFVSSKSSTEKINSIVKLEKKITELQVKTEAKNIRKDFISSFNDIKQIFLDINAKDKDIVDRPLMYEWNTWRSMVLINDALNVQGNYHADADGNPVSTASGNMPDILCEYEQFWLGVEVTLQSGMKQYETEGEPIFRHIGRLQKAIAENSDERPVYGLFVAEKINPEVISHLYAVANRNSQVYLGKVRILPLERESFVKLTESVLQHPDFNNSILLKFFEDVFSIENSNIGEIDWFNLVQYKASQVHINYH